MNHAGTEELLPVNSAAAKDSALPSPAVWFEERRSTGLGERLCSSHAGLWPFWMVGVGDQTCQRSPEFTIAPAAGVYGIAEGVPATLSGFDPVDGRFHTNGAILVGNGPNAT